MFEREAFCSTGYFARLRTHRAAVVAATALLNLSRPPRAGVAKHAALEAGTRSVPQAHDNQRGAIRLDNPFMLLSELSLE